MPVIEFEGKKFEVNKDGYLVNFNDWCEDWMAHAQKLFEINDLSDNHRKVIIFARGFYAKNNCTPTLLQVSVHVCFTIVYLYSLFLDEPRRKIGLIAGLPDKIGCVQ